MQTWRVFLMVAIPATTLVVVTTVVLLTRPKHVVEEKPPLILKTLNSTPPKNIKRDSRRDPEPSIVDGNYKDVTSQAPGVNQF